MKSRCIFLVILLANSLIFAPDIKAQVLKDKYLELARESYRKGLERCPAEVEKWLKTYKPDPVWGYSPLSTPVYLAGLASFFYEQTGKEDYARQAAKWLANHQQLKKAYPPQLIAERADYSQGLPTMTSFFDLPVFSKAYSRIKKSPSFTPGQREEIEKSIAESADYIFTFPEWGPMNRAILRAEGLLYASKALPDHPRSATWRKMAGVLASDSWGKWEEEDAQIYHPVWLHSLLLYAEGLADDSIYSLPTVRYYFDYFLHLLSPAGSVPEFGDGRWNDSWLRYLICLEKAASIYKNPEYKWGAMRIFEKMISLYGPDIGVGQAYQLIDAYRWADDSIKPKAPRALSEEVLEDLIGKKIVFRTGWDDRATYLLLNYRDEGDYALTPRDYLRDTIPVEEEKMHHGHSDENSICLLMSGGSVLLNDAGYRDGIPSGKYGAFRADYFHNRLVVRKNKLWYEQPLFEFLRNSGAYRPVVTQKIDFFNFRDVDMSRTRLTDRNGGYEWDRVIVYLKKKDFFLVFDIVKILEKDFYTLASLWHSQKILEKGDQYYLTSIERIGNYEPPQDKALLVYFAQRGMRKDSFFELQRYSQDATAVYQAVASHYHGGDIETFITVLAPLKKGEPLKPILDSIKLLDVDKARLGLGLCLVNGEAQEYICLKTDLNKEILAENIRPRYNFDSGRIKYGPIETDASFLHAQLKNRIFTYSAANMVKIIYGDQVILEALPSSGFTCQPDDLSSRTGVAKWRYWEDKVTLK